MTSDNYADSDSAVRHTHVTDRFMHPSSAVRWPRLRKSAAQSYSNDVEGTPVTSMTAADWLGSSQRCAAARAIYFQRFAMVAIARAGAVARHAFDRFTADSSPSRLSTRR